MSGKTQSTSIGLGSLIFIVFLTLKLAEIGPVAKWSWWWVTSPLWIPIAFVIAILGVGFFIILGATLLGFKPKSKEEQPKIKKSRWQTKLEELQKDLNK